MREMSRSYHQFCGIARALDLVEQRWLLLIVRELVLRGPLSAAALARGLPGVPSNQLADRLTHLEAVGLVSTDEPTGSRPRQHRYSLTDAGRRLEPVVAALAEFGLSSVDRPVAPDEVVLPHVLMRQLELGYDVARARREGFTGRFVLVLDDPGVLWSVEPGVPAPPRWALHADGEGLRVGRGPADRPQAILRMDVATCAGLVTRSDGLLPIRVSGDRRRALRLLSLLRSPTLRERDSQRPVPDVAAA